MKRFLLPALLTITALSGIAVNALGKDGVYCNDDAWGIISNNSTMGIVIHRNGNWFMKNESTNEKWGGTWKRVSGAKPGNVLLEGGPNGPEMWETYCPNDSGWHNRYRF